MSHLDQTFGIEIECYMPVGMTHRDVASALSAQGITANAEGLTHQTRAYWKVTTDGSLGDYARGCEVVSPVLRGAESFETVRAVYDCLEELGCSVTRACGLHVHVGARGKGVEFFKSATRIYRDYETIIDGFMPLSRRSGNQYCAGLAQVMDSALGRAVSVEQVAHCYSRTCDPRYHKLNVAAYSRHGTIEFRQHGATLNADKALRWVSFCLRFAARCEAMDAARAPRQRVVSEPGAFVRGGVNRARVGSDAWRVGEMLLRPEGVTRGEAMAEVGWPSISLPQQAAACGLAWVMQARGRERRYFAVTGESVAVAAPVVASERAFPVSLEGLMDGLGCDAEERAYFAARTRRLSGMARAA